MLDVDRNKGLFSCRCRYHSDIYTFSFNKFPLAFLYESSFLINPTGGLTIISRPMHTNGLLQWRRAFYTRGMEIRNSCLYILNLHKYYYSLVSILTDNNIWADRISRFKCLIKQVINYRVCSAYHTIPIKLNTLWLHNTSLNNLVTIRSALPN